MRIVIVAALMLSLTGAVFAQTSIGAGAPPQPRSQQSDRGSAAVEGAQADRTAPIASITCRVGGVAAYRDRVHVQCGGDPRVVAQTIEQQMREVLQGMQGQAPPQPGSGPTFFAVGLPAEPALAALTVDLATHASAHNRQVQIFFVATTGENPHGCAPNDCRRLVGIALAN
jgi:hypothetical protein